MPLSRFVSEHPALTVSVSSDSGTLREYIETMNRYPVGTIRRYEMEAALYRHMADYMSNLAIGARRDLRVPYSEGSICDNG